MVKKFKRLRFGSDNKIWLKANWNFSVISHTLSLNLGVVQVFAFVASENSMFDSQFSLIARTRLHQLRVKNSLRFHSMAIYRVKFFNQISLSVPKVQSVQTVREQQIFRVYVCPIPESKGFEASNRNNADIESFDYEMVDC
jgi:hypothetical protein